MSRAWDQAGKPSPPGRLRAAPARPGVPEIAQPSMAPRSPPSRRRSPLNAAVPDAFSPGPSQHHRRTVHLAGARTPDVPRAPAARDIAMPIADGPWSYDHPHRREAPGRQRPGSRASPLQGPRHSMLPSRGRFAFCDAAVPDIKDLAPSPLIPAATRPSNESDGSHQNIASKPTTEIIPPRPPRPSSFMRHGGTERTCVLGHLPGGRRFSAPPTYTGARPPALPRTPFLSFTRHRGHPPRAVRQRARPADGPRQASCLLYLGLAAGSAPETLVGGGVPVHVANRAWSREGYSAAPGPPMVGASSSGLLGGGSVADEVARPLGSTTTRHQRAAVHSTRHRAEVSGRRRRARGSPAACRIPSRRLTALPGNRPSSATMKIALCATIHSPAGHDSWPPRSC